MITDLDKAIFENAVCTGPEPGAVKALAHRIRLAGVTAERDDKLAFAAALSHGAFAAPDRIAVLYDEAVAGWFGTPVAAAAIHPLDRSPDLVPDAIWPRFWSLIDDASAGGLDAGTITMRTAEISGAFPETFTARLCEAANRYPHIASVAARPFPPKIDIEILAPCPEGSVGHALYRLIVDNQFDLEVLDRDALGLRALPKPLDYLNVRILQTHDLWHLVAGYDTTALHEIGISAFQMAQFGHAYSALFLGEVATIAALGEPMGFGMLMDVVLSAWKHGRETPPMMDIEWEAIWNEPVDAVRARHGVTPYASPYPANLLEQLQGAAG
ncbi:MAG: Coq4 family protein [Alphaproteobacteria bacterium]